MPVKITTKLDMKKFLPRTKKKFNKEMRRVMADELVKQISAGLSPVKGHGSFEKYSDGYAKKKGRKAPVDMISTGKMLGDLIVTQTKRGLSIFFRQPSNKIAKFHNTTGAGKGKVIRRLLPDKPGEEFKPFLMKKIRERLNSIVRSVAKRS